MHRSAPTAIVTCLAFVFAVLWPEISRADSNPPPPAEDASMAAAKQHFEAGRVAYNGGDYPTAIREFKAAEALRPAPVLAYNIGLANEKLQRRRVAVRYYHRYLEGAPQAPNRAEVEGRIAQLEKEIAAQPQAQPPEQAADNPPPPGQDPNGPPPPTAGQGGDPYAGQPPMTSAPPQKRRVYWWVWLLVGIGGVVVITAIVCGVVFGLRASDPYYYYSQTVPTTRVDPSARGAVLDRNSVLPTTQRTPETLPLVQFHF